MNTSSKIIILILIIISLIISINGIYLPYYDKNLTTSTKAQNLTPAGEITSEMQINQSIFLPDCFDGPIEIGLPFVTYGRLNQGKISVMLEQNSISQKYIFDSNNLDGETKKIVFNNSGFKGGLANLKIGGIDTIEGSSPSIWLTNDTLNRKPVDINGIHSNATVHMWIKFQETYPPHFNLFGGILILIVFIIGYIILILSLGIYYLNEKR